MFIVLHFVWFTVYGLPLKLIMNYELTHQYTTVPLKWTNRSLKSLKLSYLREVLRVHGFEFVPMQPN